MILHYGQASSSCGRVCAAVLVKSPDARADPSRLSGPYATAILRFYVSFPDTYPALPPLVTFSTDIFHPLITPLTTYMYTTDIQEGGTVSATDEERLPPGGFSLRHGFPGWFGRASKRHTARQHTSTLQTPPRSSRATGGGGRDSNSSTPNSKIAASEGSPSSVGRGGGSGGTAGSSDSTRSKSFLDVHKRDISTFEVLSYIRSTFDDETVLDSVPLEAAGNPGAWHAWRTHRGYTNLPEGDASARKPGEWNWEGVWEQRVKKGIEASLSEPVLFGGAGGVDDTVSWLNSRILVTWDLCPSKLMSVNANGHNRFASSAWRTPKLRRSRTISTRHWALSRQERILYLCLPRTPEDKKRRTYGKGNRAHRSKFCFFLELDF